MGWPYILTSLAMYKSFTNSESFVLPLEDMARSAGYIFLALVWAAVIGVLYGCMEGKTGQTPGKMLLGIRTVGLDLEPCGIKNGILRNLVLIVDGFFGFAVGILLVAYTARWQRLGDMAGQSIVVRKGS